MDPEEMLNNSVVLEEEYDEDYEPNSEEVIEYGESLGIDPVKEKDLLWIAREVSKGA